MKYIAIVSCSFAVMCFADVATAKTPAEIETIAKAVTVEIRLLKSETLGSGIVVKHQGDLYTIVTNRHVVCGRKSQCIAPSEGEIYTLKLGNGQQYKVQNRAVKILDRDLDLAMIQFRSNRKIPVAQVATVDRLKAGDKVYTAGYPAERPGFQFGVGGEAIVVVNQRLTDDSGGYTIIYNAPTLPGMSGGGIFDRDGRLVAIHGQGERYRENTEVEKITESGSVSYLKQEVGSKIGYNRGIPIHWVIESLLTQEIRLGSRKLVNPESAKISATIADRNFISGFNNIIEPGSDIEAGERTAIQQFSQAIRLNPRYKAAYFLRAITYDRLQQYQLALADYNQVVSLDPQANNAYINRGRLKADRLNDDRGALADYTQAIAINPQSDAYDSRGNLKTYKLNDDRGALADFNQAIAINPQNDVAYYNRGNLKVNKLKDSQGALADFNQAISINPQFAITYNNRGNLKANKLKDSQGALADFNQAISINPQFALAYFNRGTLKKARLDYQSALADYNQAILLNPQFATAYLNRGILKAGHLNDDRGALLDFDRVILLKPQDASAYASRGLTKYIKLHDLAGGIADTRQAAKLARLQQNSKMLQIALQYLQSWGVGE